MSTATVKIEGVTISQGNRKLGGIPSVSLLPDLTCGKFCGGPLLCKRDCYAKRMEQYTSVEPSWRKNAVVALKDSNLVMYAVSLFLTKHKSPFFRWHVGGDIPSKGYLLGMIRLAMAFPMTQFRCFTKAYELLPKVHPKIPNLSIGISHWPGMPVPKGLRGYTHSWVAPNPGSSACRAGRLQALDYHIPPRALSCPGNCETCHICWTSPAGTHVKFDQH